MIAFLIPSAMKVQQMTAVYYKVHLSTKDTHQLRCVSLLYVFYFSSSFANNASAIL